MILENLSRDVRVGMRVLFKDKVFCSLAVLVLALGICGVTTQFAVVNAIVLRGFSFPHPEQLASVGLIDPKATEQQNNNGNGNIPSAQDYEDFRSAQHSFALMAAYLSGSTINLTHHNTPQRLTGSYVCEDFFRIIGVAPVLGRDFAAGDNKPGAEKVVILGDNIWRRDFGADPKVVGEGIRVNGKAATVIGVMPPNFKFPNSEELWTPLYNEFPAKPRGDPTATGPQIIGRLKPDVSFDQANAEFIGLAKRMAENNPKTNALLTSASVQPLLNAFTGPQLRQTIWAMLGAVLVVLLISCVNVMNMQFARATQRTKELAIRGALGASRTRLILQMLTESFLVAAMGAILGIILAYWSIGWLTRVTSAQTFQLPYWIQFTIDTKVFVFVIAIVFAATIVSGLIPAWLASRTNTAAIIKEGGRGTTNRLATAIIRVLVVGQIALTALLLVASALQVRSIRNQIKLDYGYNERGVYCARMALMAGAYPDEEARRQFFIRAVRSLRTDPAFSDAAMSDRFQMTFANFGQYEIDGQAYPTERDRPQGNFEAVSDNYFSTLGLKVSEGRDFTTDDSDAKQAVAIVNSSFARKHWRNQSPIGRRLRVYNPSSPQPWRTVIGVVPDMLMQGPFNTQTDSAGFYVPLLGASPAPQFCTLLVRPHPGQAAEQLGPALSRSVAKLDSDLPVYFPGTPEKFHGDLLSGNRLIATLFGIFGGVAFLLSAVGLYGVMSFSVNQRTQEFGIRMALGANATRIIRLVMTAGAWQLLIGLLLGLGATALLLGVLAAAALQQILFKVNALDPILYSSVAFMLAAVAAAACFVPALRATRVNPMVALRTE